jgi:hypothetical protein
MALEDAKNPLKGVSGPGKYAKRVDRAPSEYYGQTSGDAAAASGAPLAKTPDTRPTTMTELRAASTNEPVTPLFSPSQRPNEPVTNGIDMGAGMGADALALQKPDDMNFRANIESSKPVLRYIVDLPNTSPETREAIARLLGS